jgi:hypothetical protein
MNKLSVKLILAGCLLVMSEMAVSLPVIDDFTIVPESPTTLDFISAEIEGWFPSSGYTFPTDAIVTIWDSQISIVLSASSPSGIVLPVFTPFMLNVDIGFLPSGDYVATAFLSVDGFPADTSIAFFDVSVPEPGTWLLMMTFVVLILGQRRRTAVREA